MTKMTHRSFGLKWAVFAKTSAFHKVVVFLYLEKISAQPKTQIDLVARPNRLMKLVRISMGNQMKK
jgi:hypothetical protein